MNRRTSQKSLIIVKAISYSMSWMIFQDLVMNGHLLFWKLEKNLTFSERTWGYLFQVMTTCVLLEALFVTKRIVLGSQITALMNQVT